MDNDIDSISFLTKDYIWSCRHKKGDTTDEQKADWFKYILESAKSNSCERKTLLASIPLIVS